MTRATCAFFAAAVLFVAWRVPTVSRSASTQPPAPKPAPAARTPPRAPVRRIKPVAAHTQDLNPVVRRYCVGCHSDKGKAGGLSLAAFDVAHGGAERRKSRRK